MIEQLFHAVLNYPFLTRAYIVGILVALCAALLGVNLVLKNYSLIGDGLSHVGFGAIAIASAANLAPLAVAIPVVVAAAFVLLRLRENAGVRGDSAIALISTASLALGCVVSSRSGANTDLSGYLFGSILSLSRTDLWLSVALCGVVLVLFVFFYNKLFAVTFDETFSRATGTHTGLYNTLLAVLTAVTVVLGMRLMGTLLISSLIIFPSLSAMRICHNFRSVVLTSAAVSILCVLTGLSASYLFDLPAGASVVIVNIAVFSLACAAAFFTKRFAGMKKT